MSYNHPSLYIASGNSTVLSLDDPPIARPKPTLETLLAWVNAGATEPIIFNDIDFETAKLINDQLGEEGYKARFNWTAPDKSAVFKMPHGIHELPASWMLRYLTSIESQLQATAPCAKPMLISKGSGDIKLGKNGSGKELWDSRTKPKGPEDKSPSHYEPDGSIYLQYFDPNLSEVVYAQRLPRVVLETSNSQGVMGILNRAVDYLHNSERAVHAVILCDMQYESDYRRFCAWISIWVRLPQSDMDYPLDGCRLKGSTKEVEHRVYPVSKPESGGETASIASAQSAGEIRDVHWHSRDIDRKYLIWNRTGWKRILDEVEPDAAVDETLTLNFYDFVRMCDYEQPTSVPLDRQEINLGLEWLRNQLRAELRLIRENKTYERSPALKDGQNRPKALMPSAARRISQSFNKIKEKIKGKLHRDSGPPSTRR